ncbi:unnamed protein product [Caenorhabditis auriculariae]|uniref:Vacuolar fusion protein MON1 homolog n=1 Tax=Caenorhabditis auriculariae TaxID=2777116 RepID=A0A8S1H608_9PELO|nr:unnamed protein product [Caenorhabditis auriculariae]
MEIEAPGGSESFTEDDIQNLSLQQIDLPEQDAETASIMESDETVLDRLACLPYQAFVLSEYGRPIFVNSGNEEQLCSLFAVIGIFVSRVKLWGDELMTITSKDRQIQFLHRTPLILCIVSKYGEKLDEQLEVLFEQIVSTLSRAQLESVYRKKGDNYDLRRLLRGTDRLIESSVSSWRGTLSSIHSAISVLPMNPGDREFLSATMSGCLGAAKLDGALFGVMVAHRQIASYVRFKNYVMHPRDMNIVINLVSDKSLQVAEAQTWTPICLPHFNDTGFFYAYIAYPWEAKGIPACLVLLSVKRDHFDGLNEVKKRILFKKIGSEREIFFGNFSTAVVKPNLFAISQIGSNSESLWSFVYRNHLSKQVCISASKIPLISREERWDSRSDLRKADALVSKEGHLRTLFVRNTKNSLLIWVTDKFSLQCVFGPFVSAIVAFTVVDKLLKSLKSHEQRYFIIHTPSF